MVMGHLRRGMNLSEIGFAGFKLGSDLKTSTCIRIAGLLCKLERVS